jgi:hypothetical protein
MLGAYSVAYHEHIVAGRDDDPVAKVLDYCGSLSETPTFLGRFGAAPARIAQPGGPRGYVRDCRMLRPPRFQVRRVRPY